MWRRDANSRDPIHTISSLAGGGLAAVMLMVFQRADRRHQRFGLGPAISGMIDQAKVLNVLHFTGL
jgi:hypothetical protein